MSQLLTTQQAALRMSLAQETLETWRNRGGGPDFIKLGRSVRYSEESLNEFMAKRVYSSTSQASSSSLARASAQAVGSSTASASSVAGS